MPLAPPQSQPAAHHSDGRIGWGEAQADALDQRPVGDQQPHDPLVCRTHFTAQALASPFPHLCG
jgi:hypothetical protein